MCPDRVPRPIKTRPGYKSCTLGLLVLLPSDRETTDDPWIKSYYGVVIKLYLARASAFFILSPDISKLESTPSEMRNSVKARPIVAVGFWNWINPNSKEFCIWKLYWELLDQNKFKFKTKTFKIFHIFWAARYNLWRFLKKTIWQDNNFGLNTKHSPTRSPAWTVIRVSILHDVG